MYFVIGLFFLALAAALLARAVALPRAQMSAHLREIETYGFNATAESALPEEPSAKKLRARLDELAAAIGRRFAGTGWRAPLEGRSLRAAGVYSLTAEAFHGYRIMLTVLLPGFLFAIALLSGSFGALQVLEVALAGVFSWFLPSVLVHRRAERRLDEIDRSLPELVDVLTATMEAGLGFAGSLQMVAQRFGGPLGQELRLTLQEQRMGLSTERALSNLLERCDTPSVRAFVRAVLQGESLGVSIAAMMRNLATEVRKRRRQNAHAQIQKAPVKMLFPLIFLIFPALLIVLLYPAATVLLNQFGGG
jgi:tight adherence protein C